MRHDLPCLGEGTPEVLCRESICAEIFDRGEPLVLALVLGVMVEVLETGAQRIGAAEQLGLEKVLGRRSRSRASRRSGPARCADMWVGSDVESWRCPI